MKDSDQVMNKYKPSELGEYIKETSHKRKLTQKKLAYLSHLKTKHGLPLSSIEAIESGYRQSIDDTVLLDTFAKILNIPAKKLYHLDGFRPRNIYQRIGLNFKKAIDRQHITIHYLKKLHITPTLITSWYRGTHQPLISEEISVAKKLHFNLREIDPYRQNKIKYHLSQMNPTRKLRLKNHLNLNQLSRRTGINPATLLKSERTNHFSLFNLFKLSKLYHVNINILTNDRYSMYDIYRCSNNIGERLIILRALEKFTPKKLANLYPNTFTINNIRNWENNNKKLNINDVSQLSLTYHISFRGLYTLLDFRFKMPTYDRGTILKRLRLSHKLRLIDAERRSHKHITSSELSRWENNNRQINLNKFPYLANIYRVKCSKLLKMLSITYVIRSRISNHERNILQRCKI